MKIIKTLLINKMMLSILFFVFLILNSCSKVDDALDYALNFEGIFVNSTGWEVELSSNNSSGSIGYAKYIKAGTSPLGTISVGDDLVSNIDRKNENTWEGAVRENYGTGFFTFGVVSIDGNILNIKPDNKPSYSFTRKNSSGGGSGGGGTTGTSQILINQCVSGSVGDKIFFRFNVPANVKTMVVQTTEVVGVCDRNTADLFIRKGSDPTVTKTPTYSWVADCAGIKPNRENETCTFTNPGSGQWSVMLFGYNTYFISNLKVTITY